MLPFRRFDSSWSAWFEQAGSGSRASVRGSAERRRSVEGKALARTEWRSKLSGGMAMDLTGHTVLVTGGSSGIGRALAERFLRNGSDVIVCGRRADKLEEVRTNNPAIHVRACDVAVADERVSLVDWAVREFPQLDVLVNNAGIQRRLDLAKTEPWETTHAEIAINFEAQIHMCSLLIPHLGKQKRPAIVNVTSGLAFVPLTAAPVYCATKAAFHSFTLSLRDQLKRTPIEVVEIIPPAVNTDLGGPGLHTFGTPLDEFIDAVVAQLQHGSTEITYGFSAQASQATPTQRDEILARMNQA